MAEDERPGDDEADDGIDNGPEDTAGYGPAEGMVPPWAMMPPWAAASMGFPGAMPPMGPYMGAWGAPPGMWGAPPFAGAMPPPWVPPSPMPLTASMQAWEAMMQWIATRADLWHHLFATCAEATATAARTSRSLWDRGPNYSGTPSPAGPEFVDALAASLRSGLPPEQAVRVLYDVLALHAADAARREGSGGYAATGGSNGEVDLDQLRKCLRDLPENQRAQVLWAVQAGQEWRRRWRSGSRTDGGYGR
jgi:hypothetical protein